MNIKDKTTADSWCTFRDKFIANPLNNLFYKLSI